MARGRILFISDLHLDASAPYAIAQFLAFLRTEATASDALYILGDLFETWIGDDDDDPARTRVRTALHELTAGGVPCFIQHGNRDFLLGAQFMAASGCQLLPDPVLLTLGTRRIALSHGDVLCSGDLRYQRFRARVRSASLQRAFLCLPLTTRRALAGYARAASREHTRAQRARIMDVAEPAVAALLRVADATLLIHGHTHRPDVHQLDVDGRTCLRIVLGDWYESGSYLVLDETGKHAVMPLPSTGGPE